MPGTKEIVISSKCHEFIEEAAKLTIEKGNTETNEKVWDRISDELQIAGVANEKISTELRNLVNKKILELEKDLEIPEAEHTKLNSGQYYRWVRKKGFSDPVFAHKSEDTLPQGNDADSSTFKPEVSEEKSYSILRNQLINIFKEMRKQLKENIDFIKSDAPVNWKEFFSIESESKKLFDKMQSMVVANFAEITHCKDNRQIILPTDRFLIMAIKFWAGNKFYGKKYHTIVKAKSDVSQKKLSIFLDDPFDYADLIFHTMIDPLNLHFLDIKCPICNRYQLKTIWHIDGTWNIICTNEIAHNDKKIYFDASMITKRLEELLENKRGAGDHFLHERQIEVLKDEHTKK